MRQFGTMPYRADPDRQLLEFRVSRHEIMASRQMGKIALAKATPPPPGARCVFEIGREIYDLTSLSNDAMGILNWRAAPQSLLRQSLEASSGRSSSHVQCLPHVPRTRRRKMPAADGRTTFHFDHQAISLVHPATIAARGMKGQSTSAHATVGKAHNVYVERDAAVAKDPSAVLASERALLGIEVSGEGGDQYISRTPALAKQPDGTRMLFTNILGSAENRQDLWSAIGRTARKPKPDKLEIRYAPHQVYWDEVRADPKCPDELRAAINVAATAPTGTAIVTLGTNESIRNWLYDGGRPKWKTGAYCATGRDTKGIEDPGAWRDGRGGRVQFRIIGELPKELSLEGRKKAVLELCKEFEKRKLPFVAVIHAPDYDNHPDNWHYHIIYHDRPVSRLSNGVWDFEQQTVDKANVTVAPLSWGTGKTRDTFPYRQAKNDDVRKKNWVDDLRTRAAQCVNDQLVRENQLSLRYHPGTASEIDQVNRNQEKLGTKIVGGVTAVGIANEERENDAFVSQIIGEFHRSQGQERDRHKGVIEQLPGGIALAKIKTMLDESHRERLESAISEREAKLSQNSLERVLSGPEQIYTNMLRYFSAVRAGKAKKRDQERKGEFATRFMQAKQALDDLAGFKAAQQALIADLMADSRKRTERAAQLDLDAQHEIEKQVELVNRVEVQSAVRAQIPAMLKDDIPPHVPTTPAHVGELTRLPPILLEWCDEIVQTPRILKRRNDGVVVPVNLRAEDEAILKSEQTPYSLVAAKLDRLLALQTEEAEKALGLLASRAGVDRVSSNSEGGWVVQTKDLQMAELIIRMSEHAAVKAALHQRLAMDTMQSSAPSVPNSEVESGLTKPLPSVVEGVRSSAIAQNAGKVDAPAKQDRQDIQRLDTVQTPSFGTDKPAAVDRPGERELFPSLSTDNHALKQTMSPGRADEPKQLATSAERALNPKQNAAHVDQSDVPVRPHVGYAFHGAMNRIKNEGFQISLSASGFDLSPDDLAALELTKSIIAHPDAQSRLEKHLAVQERAKMRIIAYAERFPERMQVVGKFVRFSPDSDPEMLVLLDQMRANTAFHDRLRQMSQMHNRKVDSSTIIPEHSPERTGGTNAVKTEPVRRRPHPGWGNDNGRGF
jgi:hypothetical protein